MMSVFRKSNFYKRSGRRKVGKGKNNGEVKNDEEDLISVRLGDVEKVFSNGKWISRYTQRTVSDESTTMARCLNDLEEKNNLLKLKYEILMDMMLEHLTATQK